MSIPTFQQVMELTSGVSIHTVFSMPECLAYYDLISQLKDDSTMCEIGIQYGRSSSIALQLQPHLKFRYIAVDPFVDGPGAKESWLSMVDSLPTPPEFELAQCKSIEAILPELDLCLVDGDHTELGVLTDCAIVQQYVKSGDYALFHDYGWSSTPEVKSVVDEQMYAWQDCGTFDTLHIRRRP